jgi:hypothetical protein
MNLARVSGGLLLVAGVAFMLIGVPSFVAPAWAVGEFPWTVGPFLAQTIGAWSIGTALICFHAARVGSPQTIYPLLDYAWVFGIVELFVVFIFLDKLQTGHLLTWPYLVALLALVGSWVTGVVPSMSARRQVPVIGGLVPIWAKVFGVLVGLFVLLLAFGTWFAGPTGSTARGGIFPEQMGLFSIRAFSAFLFAIASAISSVLLARSIEPYRALGWAGLYLVVPITLAALLNLSLFDFAARPGGLVYILAYVAVGLVIAAALVYIRRGHPAG